MNLKEYIASVPNYPKEGIIFRDISPLMANGKAYQYATQQIVDYARKIGAEMIVGPEARGFIVGCPVAYELGIGFAPARKKGKLPRETVAVEYDLEYGSAEISERHRHRFEFNNAYRAQLEERGMRIAGTSPDNRLVEVVEIADHPWFVASQFHPELKSRPNHPHPLFAGFVRAALAAAPK